MKDNPFKSIILCIIGGITLGTLIGVLGSFKVISQECFNAVSTITIWICLGLIVLIIDLFCLHGLLRPLLNQYIDRKGVLGAGIIENVTKIPHPNHIGMDSWVQEVRYSITISYIVNMKKYKKEFPPTILISKRELYPQTIEERNEVHIKYIKNIPSLSIIDVDILKCGAKDEQNEVRIWISIISIMITLAYVIAIIMS